MIRRDPDRIPCRWCGNAYADHNHLHTNSPRPGVWCPVWPDSQYEPQEQEEDEQ